MVEYEIQRCTRRCAATDRELKPGETVYSVVVVEGAEVVRRDYSAEGWTGPPDKALGWWKSTVEGSGTRRLHWAPHEVILHYFEQLEGDPTKADLWYVLALLMVRRRIARSEGTETDAAGTQTLRIFCPRNETEYRVSVVLPADPQRAEAIQQELARLLEGGEG
jgi:hypothetical protein